MHEHKWNDTQLNALVILISMKCCKYIEHRCDVARYWDPRDPVSVAHFQGGGGRHSDCYR